MQPVGRRGAVRAARRSWLSLLADAGQDRGRAGLRRRGGRPVRARPGERPGTEHPDEGFAAGHAAGLSEGRVEGLSQGRAEGVRAGRAAGVREGRALQEGASANVSARRDRASPPPRASSGPSAAGYDAGANDVFGGFDGGWSLSTPVRDHRCAGAAARSPTGSTRAGPARRGRDRRPRRALAAALGSTAAAAPRPPPGSRAPARPSRVAPAAARAAASRRASRTRRSTSRSTTRISHLREGRADAAPHAAAERDPGVRLGAARRGSARGGTRSGSG